MRGTVKVGKSMRLVKHKKEGSGKEKKQENTDSMTGKGKYKKKARDTTYPRYALGHTSSQGKK